MSWLRRLRARVGGSREPSSSGKGEPRSGEDTPIRRFRDGGDGSAVMDVGNERVLRLYAKQRFGEGTRISHFGCVGPESVELTDPESGPLEQCVAVVVLGEPRSDWGEFLAAGCRVGYRAKVYNQAGIGSELALRLKFDGLDRTDDHFIFTFQPSGAMGDPETKWLRLLAASTTLLVMPTLAGYEQAFGLSLKGDAALLREEVARALM